MPLLSSKTLPLTGFIFPQLQLQAPKGIFYLLPMVQRRSREKYPRTGVSCGQKKPPLANQNSSPEARTGYLDSRSTGPGPSDWRLLTRWPLSANCQLRPVLPATGRVRAPRAASPRGRIVSSGSRAPTAGPRRRRRRRSERVGGSPSARSHGSLRSSGEAGGDAELHSPGFEPTLTVASTAGRPQEKDQKRRLEPKTGDAGCKGARSPFSLATTAPRAARLQSAHPSPATPWSSGPRLVPAGRRWSIGTEDGEGAGGRGRVARRRRRGGQRRGPVGSCR